MSRRRSSPTWTVLAALLLGACTPGPSAQEPRALASSETPGATAVPDEVMVCLPAAVRQSAETLAETARAEHEGATYVVVEWTDAAGDADLRFPAVLRLDGDGCESLLPTGTDRTVDDVVPTGVAGTLSERRLDWRINRAGGPEAFADTLRDRSGGRLVECAGPPDGWTDCLAPVLAERLRQRGVAVARP